MKFRFRGVNRPAALALGAVLVLLAGCGSNNNGGNNAGNSSNAGSKPLSTAAAATTTRSPSTAGAGATVAPGQAATPTRAVGAAATAAAASSPNAGTAKTAKIGVALSLTGGGAQYGATQKNGVQLAVDEINAGAVPGVKLDTVVDDDGSDKNQVINVYQKFITQDKVAAIIGPTLSAQAAAADPVAQQAKVPVLGVSNTAAGITDIGDFIFRDSLTEADVVPQTVQKSAARLGYKNVAVMYANDDTFSKSGYDAFKAALDKQGIKIADTETFSTNDKDFSAQLTKVRDAKPDAIIVSALLDPAVGIATQARKLGLTQPIVGGNGFNAPAFIQGAGAASENVIVGAAWNSASTNPLSQKFIQSYTAKFSAAPDQFAAQAYSGVYILAKAIQTANSTEHQAIRDALPKVKDFDTVLGTFNFNSSRDAQHPAVIQVVQNGQFVPLE